MNNVNIMGRLTRDPEVKYTYSQMAICRFSIAIDRGRDKNGNDRGADFPNCVAFDRTAENIGRLFSKGRKIAISGHLQTGSYTDKSGVKHYTTDIIVDRFYFCDAGSDKKNGGGVSSGFVRPENVAGNAAGDADIPEGFEMIDDNDIPF